MIIKQTIRNFAFIIIFVTFSVFNEKTGLRLLMLDIPSPTIYGESVELQCSYELDDDQLYSVKWYKNDVEFYRFVPNDWPPGQFLPIPGIRVDLSRSGKDSVYLRQLDLKSEGIYRCEVSAEAPEFKTAELEKEMKVYLLPTEGPRITGGKVKYQVGDEVRINCTSALSKPAASLEWFINNQQAPAHYKKQYPLRIYAENNLEQITLALHFTTNKHHFHKGELCMKCTASIHHVYAMSTHAFGTLQGINNSNTIKSFDSKDIYTNKHNHNNPFHKNESNKEIDLRLKDVNKMKSFKSPTLSSTTSSSLSSFNSALILKILIMNYHFCVYYHQNYYNHYQHHQPHLTLQVIFNVR